MIDGWKYCTILLDIVIVCYVAVWIQLEAWSRDPTTTSGQLWMFHYDGCNRLPAISLTNEQTHATYNNTRPARAGAMRQRIRPMFGVRPFYLSLLVLLVFHVRTSHDVTQFFRHFYHSLRLLQPLSFNIEHRNWSWDHTQSLRTSVA